MGSREALYCGNVSNSDYVALRPQIHTHYANGLISEDFNGKSDPYLKLFINGDISHKSKTVSTK